MKINDLDVSYLMAEENPGENSINSKIPKHIVLFFETIFSTTKITIERCIETLYNSVLSLSKEGKSSLKNILLYENLRDLIRDLDKLEILVRTPYQLAKQLLRKF